MTDSSSAISRFDADGTGETTCVVFANSFDQCKESLAGVGARVLYQFPFIKAFGITVKVHRREDIEKLPEVKAVCGQSRVHACLDKAMPMIVHGKNGGVNALTGKGVTIAVLDTGASPHLDLVMPRVRIREFRDFIGMEQLCYDDNGHGTFVAHAIAGNGLTACGRYRGIAEKAELIVLKCMDGKGEAGAFKILQAMQWVYDNRKKYNIRIACMSFGSEPLDIRDPLAIGAEALWDSGITVVAAAGNSGPGKTTIKSPGISEKIITVGGVGVGEGGQIEPADFSSRGPTAAGYDKPDIVAPAVGIVAGAAGGGYTSMSGTSVATPMVAGVCALILEKNPDWSNEKIKSEIIKSAVNVGGEKNETGYGMISLNE